jgi:hypothetical protein
VYVFLTGIRRPACGVVDKGLSRKHGAIFPAFSPSVPDTEMSGIKQYGKSRRLNDVVDHMIQIAY